jgi:uncharacterized protein (TIGR00369 family)
MNSLQLDPKDPDFRKRVESSFARQRVMTLLGINLARVEAGEVELTFPFREDLTQQHGFIHAGVVATALDSAAGYAAFSLMPTDAAVLTVEYKVNLLAPAKGDSFRAIAKVVKPGRTITVCQAEAFAIENRKEKLVASLTATVMAVVDRKGIEQ